MLIYSVGNKQSFEMMRVIRDKILSHLVGFPRVRIQPEDDLLKISPRALILSLWLSLATNAISVPNSDR
jgi:hypothetical protein